MRQLGHLPRPLRRLAPLFVLIGVELGAFWPLIGRLTTALHDRFDTMLNTWILSWQAYQLIRAPLAVFDAPIFHPLPDMLALSEIIWPAAPMTVPIWAVSGNPLLVYNLTFLGTFFLAALGMYALALHVTHCRWAALLAGVFYGFSPYQFVHLAQVQLLSIGWLPLTLLYLDRFWTSGRRRDGLLLAFFIAAQTLSTFYYGFQVVMVVGLYVLVRLLMQPGRPALRRLGQSVPWLGLAALLILPFALPYLRVRAGLGLERSLTEAAQSGAALAEFFLPRADNPVYPTWLSGLVPGSGDLFPGIVCGLLAVTGFIAWRKIRRRDLSRIYLVALGLAAWILALGPRLKLSDGRSTDIALPFAWLFEHVPGMTVIRAPGRFSVALYLVLALAVAAGAAWLLGRLRWQTARGAVCALLITACLAETLAGRETFTAHRMPALDPGPPAYAWLAQQEPGVLLELPLTSEIDEGPPQGAGVGEDAYQAWPDFNRMRYQFFETVHWQPIVDGYSGFRPPHHRELGLSLASFPDERSLTMLRGLDVTWVLVHSQLMEAFQSGRAATLRARLERMPGIEHVQDFGAEWLYRIEPARLPAVTGRFWSADGGHTGLLLTSLAATEAVIPPDTALQIKGAWTPLDGGRATAFALAPRLPLIVGAGSSITLDLPQPAAAGRYRLHLEATGWALPAYDAEVTLGARNDRGVLLPIAAEPMPEAVRVEQVGAGRVTLGWRLLDRPDKDASVSLRLLAADGQEISWDDQALGGGFDLVKGWQPGLVLTTTHNIALPADALGVYSLRAFLFRPNDATAYYLLADGAPVEVLTLPVIIRPAQPAMVSLPPAARLAAFGENVYLLDTVIQPPARRGEPFVIAAGWTTAAPLRADYTIFAHLVDANGTLIAQQDQRPLGGRYPTTIWTPGEVVSDTLTITLPDGAGGQQVCLQMGLYNLSAGVERLVRTDGSGDFWSPGACWVLPGQK